MSSEVVIFLSLIILFLQIISPSAYSLFFGNYNILLLGCFSFTVMYSFCFFFVLPATLNQLLLKEKLATIGLQIPQNKKRSLMLIIVTSSLLFPYMYFCAGLPCFQRGYPLKGLSPTDLIYIQFPLLTIYYFAEEFFFRGFLFLTLWRKIGWHSFWITDIIFTISHLGKPIPEILLCIPVSIIFNLMTLFTRSIVPTFIVHYALGLWLIHCVRAKGF